MPTTTKSRCQKTPLTLSFHNQFFISSTHHRIWHSSYSIDDLLCSLSRCLPIAPDHCRIHERTRFGKYKSRLPHRCTALLCHTQACLPHSPRQTHGQQPATAGPNIGMAHNTFRLHPHVCPTHCKIRHHISMCFEQGWWHQSVTSHFAMTSPKWS